MSYQDPSVSSSETISKQDHETRTKRNRSTLQWKAAQALMRPRQQRSSQRWAGQDRLRGAAEVEEPPETLRLDSVSITPSSRLALLMLTSRVTARPKRDLLLLLDLGLAQRQRQRQRQLHVKPRRKKDCQPQPEIAAATLKESLLSLSRACAVCSNTTPTLR